MSERREKRARKRSNPAAKKILMAGNEAIGKAAVVAGCRFYAGYPITPQNELTAYMSGRMREEGRGFVQAESELAAINMVFGASCTGRRAMTTSSSPGISLKQEGISYLAGCQLPSVIVNVMRSGPGLGNITPAQSDYFQATKGGGHGDYRMIVLAPASVQECFDLTVEAFNLADKYRNPVMILADAFLGQMAEPVVISGRKQRASMKKKWALTGCKGRQSNIIRSLFLGEGVLEKHNLHLQQKYRQIDKKEKRFQGIQVRSAEIILVAYGTAFRIAEEAAEELRKDNIKTGLFRPVTLWPFPYKELEKCCKGKKQVFVFELSYGQMVEDVRLAVTRQVPVSFYGRAGGGVFTAEELIKFVLSKL